MSAPPPTTPSPTPLQLGVYLPTWRNGPQPPPPWPELRRLALLAETAGIDTIWIADHWRPLLPDGSVQDFWESWTTLAALAAATDHITLGPLITPTAFRHPALLARMAVTLDEISAGRLILGLGAGAARERSFELLGLPPERRASLFAEALQIIVPLLRDGYVDHTGDAYHVRDHTLGLHSPRPAGPPIWIAGQAPRMMRLAARWGDAFNLNRPIYTADALAQPFAQLDAACHDQARDPATLARTAYTTITFAPDEQRATGPRAQWLHGPPEAIAQRLLAIKQAGVSHLTCNLDDGHTSHALAFPPLSARAIEQFAPVIAALRSLERAAIPTTNPDTNLTPT